MVSMTRTRLTKLEKAAQAGRGRKIVVVWAPDGEEKSATCNGLHYPIEAARRLFSGPDDIWIRFIPHASRTKEEKLP